MNKLMLNDLLHLSKEELSKTRIKLNVWNGYESPISIYKKNPADILKWNYWNSKTYRIGDYSICLVRIEGSKWLFCHLGRVDGVIDIPKNSGVGYTYTEDDRFSCLYGRVVVRFHNTSRTMFRWASGIIDQLEVVEILPSVYTGFDFPGYENVCLTWKELHTIVSGNYPSYQNALRKQKAVYLQTDTHTGRLYVGSATSDKGMLLARWSSCAANGHGGNKGLHDLVKKEGFDYIKKYFTYTILENYNQNTEDSYVLQRESYWKRVLKSREFGYNEN